ncbi:hypothetical protein KR032_005807, partial [Drosophila birchii]
KSQCSAERAPMDAPESKRKRGPQQAGPPPNKTNPSKRIAKVSEVTKRHLNVALIDRSDDNGKMSGK